MKKKLKSIKAKLRDHLFSKIWNLEVVWQLTREDYIKKKKNRSILSKISGRAIKLSKITARAQPSSNRRDESERELNYQPLVESDVRFLNETIKRPVFYAPLSLFIPVSMKFQIGRVT